MDRLSARRRLYSLNLSGELPTELGLLSSVNTLCVAPERGRAPVSQRVA